MEGEWINTSFLVKTAELDCRTCLVEITCVVEFVCWRSGSNSKKYTYSLLFFIYAFCDVIEANLLLCYYIVDVRTTAVVKKLHGFGIAVLRSINHYSCLHTEVSKYANVSVSYADTLGEILKCSFFSHRTVFCFFYLKLDCFFFNGISVLVGFLRKVLIL